MNEISVFYRVEQVAPVLSAPGARKPRLVVDDWLAHGLPIGISSFEPARREDLVLAHAPAFVDGVLACRVPNGFRTRQHEVADSLPYTSGSLIAACEHVLTLGARVACSPTSGFHHSGFDEARGFCTFNGLMVAALVMRRDGLIPRRLGILDCDYHFGDGTQEIIDRLGIDWIVHDSLGMQFPRGSSARDYLAAVRRSAAAMASCDLVIYQAGADLHVDDPLGGVLSSRQMRERDDIVFRTFAENRTRVVWNLAGGYQEEPDGSIPKVLQLHRETMKACVDAYL